MEHHRAFFGIKPLGLQIYPRENERMIEVTIRSNEIEEGKKFSMLKLVSIIHHLFAQASADLQLPPPWS